MTWFNVINCVNVELFPVLSIALRKCVEEKLTEDPAFKVTDFGAEVIEDIMERLKAKRTMNNLEIKLLKALFQRAMKRQNGPSSVCLISIFSSVLTVFSPFKCLGQSAPSSVREVIHRQSARISVLNGPD